MKHIYMLLQIYKRQKKYKEVYYWWCFNWSIKKKPKIGDSCITYVLIKLDNNNFRWVSVVCEVVQLSDIIVGKWELEIRHEEKIIRKIYGYKKLPNLIYSRIIARLF